MFYLSQPVCFRWRIDGYKNKLSLSNGFRYIRTEKEIPTPTLLYDVFETRLKKQNNYLCD